MPVSPILTVDVEDWFHVCGDTRYGDPSTWEGRESRVHLGTDRILEALSGTASRATFFVLGWVARKHPALVKRITEAGHEVGCHGDLHRRVFEMTPSEFREDVRRSRGTLEDLLGSRILVYRAPEWSMRSPDNPALAVLAEEGFEIDSSLVPAPPVGLATNPVRPVWLTTPAGPLLEVPPLMGTFFLRRAILGGGVCSRMSRFSRVAGAIERTLLTGDPPVLYLHPWEVDDEHPPMELPLLSRLIHFGGRRRAMPRLTVLLSRHTFQPISSAREAAGVRPAALGTGAAA